MVDSLLLMFAAFPLAAYVVGSTPSGVILARFRGVDLRKVGSGNVGATNVGRALGHRWGYLCFCLDVMKGLLPTLAAGILLRTQEPPTATQQAAWLATGCAAIAGHVFSFYLKFRGGKGVATSLGVVLGIFPYFTWAGLAARGVWVAVTLTSRYVSLGSITAAVVFLPIFAAFNWSRLGALWPMALFAGVMIALIVVRHRENIRRLLAGQENRIGRGR